MHSSVRTCGLEAEADPVPNVERTFTDVVTASSFADSTSASADAVKIKNKRIMYTTVLFLYYGLFEYVFF